jgi:hypothetical protein
MYKILVGNLGGKIPQHRRRWKDNIKMDIREIVWEDMDWMHLAQVKDH